MCVVSWYPVRMSSRAKGARGELEACEVLGRIGMDCIRSVQYSGRNGTADIVCDGVALHFEVKRTERLSPYQFMDQAIRDAKTGSAPVVIMRSSYKPWLLMLRVDDAIQFAEEVLAARERSKAQEAAE